MRNCKIIQDLFPNYIEKLTSGEANEYIESHIKECKECSEKLKIMQKEIEVDRGENFKRETKYLKKYNHKLRILEALILAAIIIFIGVTARKMIIINSMQNKIMKYEGIDNYYIKKSSYQGDVIYFSEIYKKENKYKSKISNLWIADENTRMDVLEVFGDGQSEKWYSIDNFNNKDNKTVTIFEEGTTREFKKMLGMYNFETNNIWDLLIMAICSDISSENCNGKECYRISYTFFIGSPKTPIIWQQAHYRQIYYLEKETGLPIRSIDNRDIKINNGKKESIIDFEYDFENVTDDDIKEPDIKEYQIIKE